MATQIDVVEINNDNNDNNNRLQTNETETSGTSDEVEINNKNDNVLESVEVVDNACNFSTETHANDVNTIEDQTYNTNTKLSNEDENHENHEKS